LDPYKQSGNVIHDEPNDFGVAGLIGNVREWCDSAPNEHIDVNKSELMQRLILGATGYLGESTFNFEYGTPLYPRNTNPDVGFRISRTLGSDEVEILRKREAAIAALAKGF
jgi:formylglycine-generating enzyme required for sulfatase activity